MFFFLRAPIVTFVIGTFAGEICVLYQTTSILNGNLTQIFNRPPFPFFFLTNKYFKLNRRKRRATLSVSKLKRRSRNLQMRPPGIVPDDLFAGCDLDQCGPFQLEFTLPILKFKLNFLRVFGKYVRLIFTTGKKGYFLRF